MRAAPVQKKAALKLTNNMKNDTNAAPEPQPETPAPDIVSDLANIRVDPTMADGPIVKKILAQVPVRKPSKEWFVRTHHDTTNYCLDALVLELKEDGEIYLIPPELHASLLGEACVHAKRLWLAVNRQGGVFIWAIRIPGADGKLDSWNQSALEAAALGTTQWVRVSANRQMGNYKIDVADFTDEPHWPDRPFTELLRIAFKGKVIETLDHPVLKRLRGEI